MKRIKLEEKVESDLFSFSPHPIEKFNLSFPLFKYPTEIGCFSLDSHHAFHNDKRQLKYLCISLDQSRPAVSYNLKKDYENVVTKQDSPDKIDSILNWILKNRQKCTINKTAHSSVSRLSAEFVCWRGLLTKILCTPYENFEDWIICVTLFQGTYYLCEFETERKKNYEENKSEYEKILCYGGYKFESYITSSLPDGPSRQNDLVNLNEAYCSVVTNRMNQHVLLYAGEIDCIDPKSSEKSPKNYVELKTTKEPSTERQKRNFKRFKLSKWWCQCFTIGIPTIVCGFRDEYMITNLKKYKTDSIPKRIDKDFWNPAVCFNFCDQFLSFIKTVVTADDPNIVYKFEWKPGNDIRHKKVKDIEFQILPHWYIDSMICPDNKDSMMHSDENKLVKSSNNELL